MGTQESQFNTHPQPRTFAPSKEYVLQSERHAQAAHALLVRSHAHPAVRAQTCSISSVPPCRPRSSRCAPRTRAPTRAECSPTPCSCTTGLQRAPRRHAPLPRFATIDQTIATHICILQWLTPNRPRACADAYVGQNTCAANRRLRHATLQMHTHTHTHTRDSVGDDDD